MIAVIDKQNQLVRMNAGRSIAFAVAAWGWLWCVAFGFGSIEAQWLASKDRGYVIVGFGILVADCASMAIYWWGWSLRRFFVTWVLAVCIAAVCMALTMTADFPAFASSGILAAPILVHSAAICFWFKDRITSASRAGTGRFLRIVNLTGAVLCCLLGSAVVSLAHMADLFARSKPGDVPKLAALFGEGVVGGVVFWILFGSLSSQIARRGNEELRHHLEGLFRLAMELEEAEDRPMNEKVQSRVFISYVRENLEEVRRICTFLEGEGFTVIWDQNLKPGQNWKEELTDGIQQADAVLVCFSEQSEKRKESEFYAEIRGIVERARNFPPGAIFLIPVRLSECEVPSIRIDSNTTLNSLQSVDLFPDSRWNGGLQLILASLRRGSTG